MDRNPLIGVSICAVVLLVLGSLSSVVGIESSQGCGCSGPPCWPVLFGTMGDNNWYVSKVEIIFFGTLNNTIYRIDGSDWITYTEPFTLKTQGIHLLEWTCDSNMSNISSLEIKIDWEPPILDNYSRERLGLFIWQFSVEVFDEFSGVNRVWCAWGGYDTYDTEPPYQFIFKGFYRLINLILSIFSPWTLFKTFDAWDNAGNNYPDPSYC